MSEWKLVLDPTSPTNLAEGFDRDKEYEFYREGWDVVGIYRLRDCSPAFNLYGLKYREIAALGGNTDAA